MTEHEKRQRDEELRERWIESLLMSATSQRDHTDRIDCAISQLETQLVVPHSAGPARSRIRFLQWGSIGVAAAVVLALFLLVQTGGSQSAMAAIERSLNVASQRTTRKYLLQIEYRPAIGETRTFDNDLYVQGSDRFALRHPGLLSDTSFWLGGNGVQSWVLPAFGPVLKGDNTVLSRWLRSRKEMDTPYLHVTTVMKRMMSRGYRLEALSDEQLAIPDGLAVECEHIRAERTTPDQPDLPDTIELWASLESGMAVKLIARWQLEDGEIGRESIVLTFQNEEPSLSDDWFTAEAHYEGFRAVIDSSGN